jgi:Na+-transporting NADH:ubiquinone oxidoreductase subunit NqrE
MKRFRKNMMNIFFADLRVNLAADFQIRARAALPKTMITLKKYFISEAMGIDIPLHNLQDCSISPGKTRTAQTDYNFTSMIHYLINSVVKIKKIDPDPNFQGNM